MQKVRLEDLHDKEIINLQNGYRLGFAYDAEISLPEGQVKGLVIPGAARLFGLLGRDEDIIVPWEAITKIGDDIILVDIAEPFVRPERRRHVVSKKRGIF